MPEEVVPSSAAVAPAAKETPSGVADETAGPTAKPDEPEPQSGKKPWAQRRIDELTRNWRETERDRDYWRELAVGKKPAEPKPEQPKERKAPEPKDFRIEGTDTYDQARYLAAVSRFETESILEEREAKRKEADQKREQETAQQKRVREWNERVTETRKSLTDWDEVLEAAAEIRTTPAMDEAILRHKRGPEIAYFLAQNPNEAAAILALDATDTAIAIGEIGARLAKPEPQELEEREEKPDKPSVPPAAALPPAPPQTVRTASAPKTFELNTADIKDTKKWDAEFQKKLAEKRKS